MAEQLAENYHNAWAQATKLELESKGTVLRFKLLLEFSDMDHGGSDNCSLILTRYFLQEGAGTRSLCLLIL